VLTTLGLLGVVLIIVLPIVAGGGSSTPGSAPAASTSAHPKAGQPAKPQQATKALLSRSGKGNWNSPPFHVTGSPIKVTFRFSGNSSLGSGDNFIMDVISPANFDDLSIANTIGVHGGKTTTVYPSSAGQYHVEIQATGDWAIKLTQR